MPDLISHPIVLKLLLNAFTLVAETALSSNLFHLYLPTRLLNNFCLVLSNIKDVSARIFFHHLAISLNTYTRTHKYNLQSSQAVVKLTALVVQALW